MTGLANGRATAQEACRRLLLLPQIHFKKVEQPEHERMYTNLAPPESRSRHVIDVP